MTRDDLATRGFDMTLVQRGARLRYTPFHEATQRHAPRGFTVYNHVLFPTNYDDFEAEYEALLEGVTVWDVSVERQLEITGPDAFEFTNRLTPRDLTQCAVGQGKYAIMTAQDGGMVNDPVLLRLGENHFWLAAADSDILLWAKGVALHSGLDVTLGEPDVAPMQVQGPRSRDVIGALFGDAALELGYYWFLDTELDGIPVIVTRTGWSGEVGYEIYLRDATRGTDLWDRVMEAGEPYAIRPTGPSDIRRIEAGILNYGVDMTLDNNPYEIGLGWQVDFEQPGDFIGREALRQIRDAGVQRKLVGVEIDGAPLPMNMTRWPVLADGDVVGRITSAVYSPRLQRNIGYANVPVERAELGSSLEVIAEDGSRRAAVVVPKPFVDPDKEIPKT